MMPERFISVDGVAVPRFLYGTAWKEDETQRLTELALRTGFRGIDTANQRRHYHEAAVGKGISAANDLVGRKDLFLQTKFTSRRGQDHRAVARRQSRLTWPWSWHLVSGLSNLGPTVRRPPRLTVETSKDCVTVGTSKYRTNPTAAEGTPGMGRSCP